MGIKMALVAAVVILAALTACAAGELVEQQHPQRELVGHLELGLVDFCPLDPPLRRQTPTPPPEAGTCPKVSCSWLVDASGRRWEVFWPDGWETADFPVRLLDPSGRVVAGADDLIRVSGPADAIGDSVCTHDVFPAKTVVVIDGSLHSGS